MRMYTHSMGSGSAKALCEALDIKRVKHEGKPLEGGVLINWGASRIKRAIMPNVILNHPGCVLEAVNKLRAFKAMAGMVSIPDFTESIVEANKWLAEGFDVVARHSLTGNSGKGIRFHEAAKVQAIDIDAPLYTRYVPKTDEYRIHVFEGKIHFEQRKALKNGAEAAPLQWKIRNHGNGFIFAHKGLEVPKPVRDNALAAVAALGLDFGAVDIGWHPRYGTKVYEVNTAPGLEGSSLDSYVEQFRRFA